MDIMIEELRAIYNAIEDPTLKSIEINQLKFPYKSIKAHLILDLTSIEARVYPYYCIRYEFVKSYFNENIRKNLRDNGFSLVDTKTFWYKINKKGTEKVKENLLKINSIFLKNNTKMIPTLFKSESELARKLSYRSWKFL